MDDNEKLKYDESFDFKYIKGKATKRKGYKSLFFLLENHFDFMNLIPKCLAIEVTKENNPYN